MAAASYGSKVMFYGGYPGSSGRPVAGRLEWRDGTLRFVADGGGPPLFEIERQRLLDTRRAEEGMTGARRVRLLIDVKTDSGDKATLKFEMRSIWRKEAGLRRWLEVLGPVCGKQDGDDV